MKHHLARLAIVLSLATVPFGSAVAGDEPPDPTALTEAGRHTRAGALSTDQNPVFFVEESRQFVLSTNTKARPGGPVPLVVVSDGAAQMVASHTLYYQKVLAYYSAWTAGYSSSNYVSSEIYVFLKHRYGSSCQSTAIQSGEVRKLNSSRADASTPKIVSYKGTKNCVWGRHWAKRASNPSYNLFYEGTFPSVVLP